MGEISRRIPVNGGRSLNALPDVSEFQSVETVLVAGYQRSLRAMIVQGPSLFIAVRVELYNACCPPSTLKQVWLVM